MGNRKQPFGYKIELGAFVPQPQEAETVRHIYKQYLAGESFKRLAEQLREQDVPCDADRPWNKNMIARILEDRRYIGTDCFPALIATEQFHAAQERRKKTAPERKQTPTQKELRKLCGCAPMQYVEYQVLKLLNRAIRNPQMICLPESSKSSHGALERQRRELEEILHRPPVDEEQVREMALSCAAAALESIGPEEYETERLQRLFRNHQPMQELDAELLRQSVQRITYGSRTVKVLLKNHQMLEEREQT